MQPSNVMDSESQAESPQLRVSIFPYIPDLAGDKLAGLKSYITAEFKKQTGILVSVESCADPYDWTQFQTYFSSDKSYDIMEVDTLLLGWLVNHGYICPLDRSQDDMQEFFPWCVESVTLNGEVYGIPTLQCANFLVELASGDHICICPVLKNYDWKKFASLYDAIEAHKSETGHKILVAGDFRGTWGLPMLYLDAYADKSSSADIYEGIDAPIDDELIQNLQEFTDLGKLPSGKNPDTDQTFHKCHNAMIKEAVKSKHIMAYCYSENLSEIFQEAAKQKKHLRVVNIGSTPLDRVNRLMTYTDAVVINKHSYADSNKRSHIKKFIDFYTSFDFRKQFVIGFDLPQSATAHIPPPARWVLPTITKFFLQPFLFKAFDKKYIKLLHILLDHSIAAPNHGIDKEKLKQLQSTLEDLLGFKERAKTTLI